MKKENLLRSGVLFLTACLALSFVPGSPLHAEVIEQVLVKVNGEIFTKSDLEQRQTDALRQMGQQIDPKDKNLGDAQLKKMLDQVTPQVIVSVVDEMLLLQRGKDLGYKLTDEQFTSVLDSIKKDNNWTTDDQLKTALSNEKMSMADLRKNVEKSVIMDRVRQAEVLSKIGISDDEARQYYNAHMAEFTKPQEITLREILVSVPTTNNAVNVGAEEAAKTKVEGIRQRAIAGESYEKLAADLSNAPSASNAGLIGPLKTNDISADLLKLLDQMKVGDITQPLRTPAGFQILKLESRTDQEITPFEKARDQISDKVFTGKRQEEYEKYLDRLRSQAIIDWKNPEIKKAYEQGLAQARAGGGAPPAQ
jgi:peptidyl-prolyl cis-trans isomerase SurA